MDRSPSEPLHIAATGYANPNGKAVDLWTTPRGVAHRVHSLSNNRPERSENCVTHVVGQKCYLCRGLLKDPVAGMTTNSGMTSFATSAQRIISRLVRRLLR